MGETHGNSPSKKLSALEGTNWSTPSGSAGSVGGAVRGRRAQKARPCPRLPNLNPFGVPTPTGTKGKQEHEVPRLLGGPTHQAARVRAVSDYRFQPSRKKRGGLNRSR